MGKRARIGLIAGAMAVAVTGRGCVTTPPPIAESVVAGPSTPSVPKDSAAPLTQPGNGGAEAQTPDERRAALDQQLDESLGAFDVKLHKEQQKTAEERDARQATVSTTTATGDSGAAGVSSAGGAAGSTEAGSTEAGSTEAGSTEAGSTGAGSTGAGSTGAGSTATARSSAGASGSSAGPGADGASATEVPGPHRGKRGETKNSRAGDLKSDKGTGSAANAGGNGALATIIPDGNDDDIVARRLRKAAELETDPELKDKLWQEYVEYKKNTQVR